MRITKISESLEKKLAEFSVGIVSTDEFEALINTFETEINWVYFTSSSEANLLRIISNMFDKVFLIRESIKYSHYIEILVTIAANSNYLTDILTINPEFFYWIVNPSALNNKLDETEFRNEIKKTLVNYNTFTSKVHALKYLKRKEILMIGLRDIYLRESLDDITKELSILAKCLAENMFNICLDEIIKKYGLQEQKVKYCLIALGKLGGNELNYSSDIDLILFYEKEKLFTNKKFLSEILTEAIQLFITSSTELSGGFLYRIDFRLRPDGKNSPLCRSLNEYLDYYESRGEAWERQMLIKTNFLAGEKSLYNKFIQYLTPFIYPFSFRISPAKQISAMKESIENKIGDEENIKFKQGGIRDIEFSVQALQLLNGGKQEQLRSGNTLSVIDKLEQINLLNKNESAIFKTSYKFYRQIEHYLQLMNDRQTHVIPEEGELLEKMSFHLSYKNSDEFINNVRSTRAKVRELYKSILRSNKKEVKLQYSYEEIYFEDVNRARSDIEFLRNGKGITGTKTFDTKSIESFDKIENKIWAYLKNSTDPDKTLSNLARIIKYANFPSIWYSEFQDNTFLTYVLSVCEFSQYSIDLFAEDKELREFLLSRKVFTRISANELSNEKIKTILFYFSFQITVGLLDPSNASGLLSKVFQIKVKELIENHIHESAWCKDYVVAALGSLGSASLTFYSDIDLIFIVRNLKFHMEIEKHFQELLSVLQINLKPFSVDCRLRPEGKSSQLVWDYDEYKRYFQKRARTWEFQALTKIMFVAGNKRLFIGFIKKVLTSLQRFDNKQIKNDLKEMRNQISSQKLSSALDIFDVKKSSGYLTDIEFIVQYLILCNPDKFVNNLENTLSDQLKLSTGRKINSLERKSLAVAYKFIKAVQLFNQLIYSRSSSKLVMEKKPLKTFAFIMNMKNSDQFIKELKSNSSKVRAIYNKLFK